ncbi:MAG: efflux RND transporter periplasmic adaptor subunit [Phenylobacterium sp.]|uniref:efflux RND transporter periplasmic adaptor subunit n=1 Tax=Phenylobacterium sp. TaxID=1871053 RepID=UPI003918E4C7
MLGRRLPTSRRLASGTAAAALTLAAAACTSGDSPVAEAPPPAVEAVAVQAPAAAAALTATGLLERGREMTLSFRIPGVIVQLSADDGERVRAGQVLARLDPTGVAAAETRADAELERARRDLARDEALFAQGFVSRQRLDDRRSAVKAAEAAARAAAFDRRWATLSSPADGVVLQRVAQAGEVVQPGQAVLRIADETSPLILRAPLADRDAPRVRIGQPATVRVEGLAEPISARVARIGARAGAQTGAVEVEIELPSVAALFSGQAASVELAVAPQAGPAYARVPAEAILEADGTRAFVLVVENGTARRRAVSFGGFDGDEALVEGLARGARVITAGAGFVGDGEKVRVVDPSRLTASLDAKAAAQ